MLKASQNQLEVSGLTVLKSGRTILDKVSFSLGHGEIMSVIGPNGGGKTTLLRVILGLLSPNSGKVQCAVGTRIGYVPQKLALDNSMPLTPRRFLSLGMKTTLKRVTEIAQRTGITHLLDQQLTGLSGGETQRVLLARAIMKKPDFLVLDEPTQGMDITSQSELFRLIGAIRQETGAAIIMVSHDLHLVMRGTDKVLCLNGHVCCTGPPAEIKHEPGFRALFGHLDEAAVVPYHHDHQLTYKHDPGPHFGHGH